MQAQHNMVNGKCTKCQCRAWEQSKPCKVQRAAKPKRERRERSYMDYAPGSGNYNDVMFGGE